MTSNTDQEREEIRDGLRSIIEQQVSLLREASIYVSRGETIPAAVLSGLVFSRSTEYSLLVRRAAVDGTPPPAPEAEPTTIPTKTIAARLVFEGVWQVYVDFMWAVPARRSAFAKAMFLDGSIEGADAPTRNSMLNAITGSGTPPKTAQEAQDIVNRVMAI